MFRVRSTQDPASLDDLDDSSLDKYKPFVKFTDAHIPAWRACHPHGNLPESVFNTSGAFKSVGDAPSKKGGLRSSGTDNLAPARDLLQKDYTKKVAFNYEEAFLPDGPPFDEEYREAGFDDPRNAVPISAYNLSALEAALLHFSGEAQRYRDAVAAKEKKFKFRWGPNGETAASETSLARALRCKSKRCKVPDKVTYYVEKLDAKIKEFKAAAAAA